MSSPRPGRAESRSEVKRRTFVVIAAVASALAAAGGARAERSRRATYHVTLGVILPVARHDLATPSALVGTGARSAAVRRAAESIRRRGGGRWLRLLPGGAGIEGWAEGYAKGHSLGHFVVFGGVGSQLGDATLVAGMTTRTRGDKGEWDAIWRRRRGFGVLFEPQPGMPDDEGMKDEVLHHARRGNAALLQFVAEPRSWERLLKHLDDYARYGLTNGFGGVSSDVRNGEPGGCAAFARWVIGHLVDEPTLNRIFGAWTITRGLDPALVGSDKRPVSLWSVPFRRGFWSWLPAGHPNAREASFILPQRAYDWIADLHADAVAVPEGLQLTSRAHVGQAALVQVRPLDPSRPASIWSDEVRARLERDQARGPGFPGLPAPSGTERRHSVRATP